MVINESNDDYDNNDDGLLKSRKTLRRLLNDTIPHQEEIVYAFGYGSGVLSQEQMPKNNGSITKQNSSSSSINNNNNINNNKNSSDSNSEQKMVDLIIVVRDSLKFHMANYQANPSHYWIPPLPIVRFMTSSSSYNDKNSSSSATSIAQWCTWCQRHEVPSIFLPGNQRTGYSWLQNPGVYYNIVDNNADQHPSLKYGVVQVDDLVEDLKHWKYLYLAGRMHKPIVTILNRQQEDDNHNNHNDIYYKNQGNNEYGPFSISIAQQDNLMAALSTSLLLLSTTTSSSSTPGAGGGSVYNIPSATIFRQVAALSYAGDFRMSYAEDPNKIDKLVHGGGGGDGGSGPQLQRFESLYHHAVSQLVQSGILSIDRSSIYTNENKGTNSSSSTMWSWDASSPLARQLLWSKLPLRLQRYQQHELSSSTTSVNPHPHHRHDNDSEWLSQQLAKIVAPAARYQSFKGIVTAGPRKAWIYAARKVAKRFWSK